jgi:hypothetical protein
MEISNLITVWSTGYLDFQMINLLGIGYLVAASLCICARLGRNLEGFILTAAIVFPLALNPGHNTCAINAACTGNHYLGLSLAIMAIFFFSFPDNIWRFLAGELLMILGIYSSPAALPVVILALWLLRTVHNQHSNLFSLLHITFSFMALAIYFWVTHPAPGGSPLEGIYANPVNSMLSISMFLLNFFGSILIWPSSLFTAIVSLITGTLILFLSLKALAKVQRYPITPTQAFTTACLALMLIIGAMITWGRFYSLGSPRYVVYASFTLMFLILFYRELDLTVRVKSRRYLAGFVLLAFYGAQFALNHPHLERIEREIAGCERRWIEKHSACGVMISNNEATDLLLRAQKTGLLPQDLVEKD